MCVLVSKDKMKHIKNLMRTQEERQMKADAEGQFLESELLRLTLLFTETW